MSQGKSQEKTVALGKDMVAATATDYKTALCEATSVADKVVIDLEGAQVIDSVGIALLIATHKSIEKAGGCMALTHVSPPIYKLLKAMKLDRHFEFDSMN